MLTVASDRFDLALSKVQCVPNIFLGRQLFKKYIVTSKYDCIVFVSDGSVPFSFAKRNIIHFQVPFGKVNFPLWKTRIYDRIVVNSEFTKQNLDPALTISRSVIYPPVLEVSSVGKKHAHTILSVGRFGGLYNAKKHDVLIGAFKKLIQSQPDSSVRLIIAGSLLGSDTDDYNRLTSMAKGMPVEFFPNCSYTRLCQLYRECSIYWHAAGYGETDPVKMEHFGISTVEAMSAGQIVAVFDGGGLPEIVSDGKDGFLWKNPDDLIRITREIFSGNFHIDQMRKNAVVRAKNFSEQKFTKSFDRLLSEIL
jgi:glycosyltransferase involved in cell wall biosynthesis